MYPGDSRRRPRLASSTARGTKEGAAMTDPAYQLIGASDNGDEYPEHLRGDAWEGERRRDSRSDTGPEPEQGDGEPWEGPIPLANVPGAEPFPLDTLPSALAGFIADAAAA